MIEKESIRGEIDILEHINRRTPSQLREFVDYLESEHGDGHIEVQFSYDNVEVVYVYQRLETDAEYKLRLEHLEEVEKRKEKKLEKDRREFERLKKLFEGETL